ncbi:restriction endonuclease subunit S [Helicobacter pylori]|uniref:restriction endonuclease subunit S n=1 Tax=Helicobacter pylori TaxID=210 RepID=UPI000FDD052C|nr:restriction endonuclease subunit S [Helicobacter pylori]RVY31473.1 restriction endonuclease subunit S [Helicobacter pylori]RVZ18588.1 restriction endonuclease subunit S [Helicobacter pylori]
MSKTLQDYATLINDTIQSNEINHYITTDNMCQNLGGIDTFKNINIPQGKVRSFQKDDILLSNIRLYFRKVYRAKQKGGCSSDVLVFRAKHIDSATLFAILSSQIFTDYACSGSQGSKMPRGNKTHMMDFKIPTINFTIAKIFNSIQNKIENNHKINELLHKILELLYEQYFVRFDFLNENNKPYQTSGGKMKFSKELNRLIPNDFEVKTLGELITWISGSQPPKSCHIYEHKEGYIRFIQNRDYSSNDYITYIPISKNNKICYQYDIMIDKYGEAGAVRFGLQGAYNVALSKISVLNQSMQEYIRSYLNSKPIKKYLSNACMASTRSSLNENHIYSLMLPIPPINLLQKYEKIAKNIITAIIKNNQSTQTLTALRDFLLPLLLKQQVKPKQKIL